MAKENTAGAGSGIGLAGLLGVAFIVLKLCNVIDWDWVWVLAPFWIPLAGGVAILLVVGVVFVLASLAGQRR